MSTPRQKVAAKPLSKVWIEAEKQLIAKPMMLFLDYDGTLTPLRRTPDEAILAPRTQQLLAALAKQSGVWVGLVSGRSIRDLKKLSGLPRFAYVGNHGFEMQVPGIQFRSPVTKQHQNDLKQALALLRQTLKGVSGILIENKGLSLSLHTRRVAPNQKAQAQQQARKVLKPLVQSKRLRLTTGKEVIEIRPPVLWDKGRAVQWLLQNRQDLIGSSNVVPVYIGDDTTDEDVFKRLKPPAMTIAVGRHPQETAARYVVPSVRDVTVFLRKILELKRTNHG